MKKITHTLTCILLVLFAGGIKAQLSGPYTIPGSYASIALAINDLNTLGVSGAVTINIAAGYTEIAPVGGYTLNTIVGASATNQITFQKSGAGANPLITAYAGGVGTPTTNTQDGVWRFAGTDYVTINGIDINDPNAVNPATMEFGYGFFKVSAANGCQNNTIRNCVITLNRINNEAGVGASVEGSRGINMVNAVMGTHTLAITATVAAGSNSNNKFYSNTIQNCNVGIALIGFADVAPYTFADSGNDIGGTSAATGNTIINYGGGNITSQAEAVITLAQYGLNVSYNTINNNNGSGISHAVALRGIYLGAAVNANVSVNNNTLSLSSGSLTNNMTAIEIAASSGTTGAVNINNNLIANCTATVATSGGFNGIINAASAGSISISSNTFSNNATAATGGAVFFINNSGSATGSLININSNIINGLNFSSANSSSSNLINNSGAGATTTLNINGNNFQNITNGIAGSTTYILINNSGVPAVHNINNNLFTNLTLNTTGSITFINSSVSMLATGIQNINGNSIVTAFNKPGSGGTVYLFNSGAGSPAGSVSNNLNNNFSNITLGGSTAMGGWNNNDGGAPTINNQNNVFTNWTCGTGAITGILVNYNGASTISNNTISAFTTSASITGILYGGSSSGSLTTFASNSITSLTSLTGGGAVTGINLAGGASTLNVNNNILGGYSTQAGSAVSGILCSSFGSSTTFSKNKIYDLSANNAGATIAGLTVSGGGTVRVSNNLIGDLRNPIGLGTNIVNGIVIGGGSTVNLYFNTVYLTGTSSGANFGSTALNVSSSSPAVYLRNNIFVNNATAVGTGSTVAFRRTVTTLTSYSVASNNNLFYAGVPSATNVIYYNGTSTYSTLALFKAHVAAREGSAITENPTFVSTTGSNANFLNINTSVPTQIESGGSAIAAVADDFAGTVRNATTPDIGAWEGTFVLNDIAGPGYSGGGLTTGCSVTAGVYTISISDVSGIATGTIAPRLYYKINGGAYTSVQGTLASGTNTIGVWNFNLTFTSLSGDVMSYYVVAQDVVANLSSSPVPGFSGTNVNTIATPPTTPFTYIIGGTLNGVYTVGAGQTFTSLTQAAQVYNVACLAGPVTFSLTDALYSASEIFPVTFLNNTTASATNSLLIKPATAITAVITGTAADAMIKVIGGDYIKIDGSNNGTTSQNLTIENTNAVSTAAVIWIGNSSATDAASNITVNNSIITGSTGITSVGGIILSSGITLGSAAEISNNNMTISGNTFLKTQNGIFAIGNATTLDANWRIANNTFGSTVAASKLGFRGVAVQNAQVFSIVTNTVIGITNNIGASAGILAGAAMGNATISANVVSGIRNTSATAFATYGIQLTANTTTATILVNNNMISDVSGNGSATTANNGHGIFISNGAGYKIYHNTVLMNTNQTSTSGVPSAFFVTAGVTAAGAIDLRNNIFANTETVGNGYSIYSLAPSTIFSAIDFNNYTTASTNLAFIGSARANLAALQTGFGNNVNSRTITPVFVGSPDLHLVSASNGAIDNLGTPVAVTIDIDNQSRNATAPDMGADEFDGPACTSATAGTTSVLSYSACSVQSLALSYSGNSNGNGITYQWKVASAAAGPYTNVATGAGFNTQSYNTNGAVGAGTYYYALDVVCAVASSTATAAQLTVSIVQTPTLAASATSTNICVGQNLQLNAATNVGTAFSWTGPNAFSSSLQNPLISSATSSATGTYSLLTANGSCSTTIVTLNVIVNVYPSAVTVSPASPSICAGTSQTLAVTGGTAAAAYIFGTQTNTNTASTTSAGYPAPYSVYYGGQRMQILIRATELQAAGFIAGTRLNNVQFPVVSLGANWGGSITQLLNFQVSMGTTTLTTLTTFQSGLTVVSPAASYTPAVGLNTNPFATAFIWDGTSNVILESTFSNVISGATADAVFHTNSPTSYQSTIVYRSDSEAAASVAVAATPNFIYSARPDFRLNGVNLYPYLWSPSTGLSATTGSLVASTTTATTIYSVVANNNGCGTGTAVTVSVMNPTVAISGASGLCTGQSATLTASGANTYTWDTGEMTATVVKSPTTTTTYTVIGSSAFGCTTSATQLVTVAASLSIAISGPNGGCINSAIPLTASGGVTYTWSTGATTFSIAPTFTGTTTYSVIGASGTCSNSAVKTVTVNPDPVLAISGNTTICAGQSTTITASGASTYSWTTGATTASIGVSPTTNTVYTIIGTSSLGCAVSKTVGVTSNTVPVINVAFSSTAVCIGTPATLTASGATNYTWTSGPQTASNVVTPAASNPVYVVTGANAAGCLTSKQVTLTTYNLPVVTIAPATPTICATATLNLTASGAGTGGTYNWTGGPSTSTYVVSPANSTTYTVIGTTTNNCTATKTVAVVTNTLPVLSIAPAVSQTVCSFAGATFTASGATSYTWSGNASFFSNVSYFPGANTTYTVTGKNAANCLSTATVAISTLTLPVVTLAPATSTVCIGSNQTFTAGGAVTYSWANNTSTATTAVYAVTTPTSINVTGTGPNGCHTTTNVLVFTSPLPTVAIAASSQTICALSPVTFTATGANTYSWNTGVTTSVVTYSPANSAVVYTVTGTDTFGCSNSGTISVVANPLPAVAITPASTVVCRNTSVGLTASGAASYAWSHNGSVLITVNVTPTTTTTYSVTGTDVLGCVNTASATVTVNQLPTVLITPASATICSDNGSATFTASGATSYVWNAGATTDTFTANPSVPTVYTVTGTDANNCVGKAIVGVEIDPCTGIKTRTFSGNDVSVYPNPSNGAFTAKFEFEGNKTITITNSVGQLISETTTANTSETFNLSGVAKGVYFVKVSTGTASGNYKLIIE